MASAPPISRKNPPSRSADPARVSMYSRAAHTPTKSESRIETLMNTMWNTLSDILHRFLDRCDFGVRHPHQHTEKGQSQHEYGVDQLLLRQKMHEVPRDQESLDASNEQSHRDGLPSMQVEVTHPHGNEGQRSQRHK